MPAPKLAGVLLLVRLPRPDLALPLVHVLPDERRRRRRHDPAPHAEGKRGNRPKNIPLKKTTTPVPGHVQSDTVHGPDMEQAAVGDLHRALRHELVLVHHHAVAADVPVEELGREREVHQPDGRAVRRQLLGRDR